MYTQFFGNFLLSKDVVTTDTLLEALKEQSSTHLKLGTLAIHAGLLSADEVDCIVIMQTHQDKKFGELAIEGGYLTPDQVNMLLSSQKPDYLLLGQYLVEHDVLNYSQFEDLLLEYQSYNEIFDLDISGEQKGMVEKLIARFCDFDNTLPSTKAVSYLSLLFNNIIRFIGNDFTPLNPIAKSEYLAAYCVRQDITGEFPLVSALDLNRDTAISFAARYAKEDFHEFDDYVKASIEDFLNLHNGLFTVNMSNDFSMELTLSAPEVHTEETIFSEGKTYIFPVIFPFGTLNFLISF